MDSGLLSLTLQGGSHWTAFECTSIEAKFASSLAQIVVVVLVSPLKLTQHQWG